MFLPCGHARHMEFESSNLPETMLMSCINAAPGLALAEGFIVIAIAA